MELCYPMQPAADVAPSQALWPLGRASTAEAPTPPILKASFMRLSNDYAEKATYATWDVTSTHKPVFALVLPSGLLRDIF